MRAVELAKPRSKALNKIKTQNRKQLAMAVDGTPATPSWLADWEVGNGIRRYAAVLHG